MGSGKEAIAEILKVIIAMVPHEEHMYFLWSMLMFMKNVDENCRPGGNDKACSTFKSLAHSSPLWGG